jgi:excisionase family DNA binding protein
LVFIKFLWDAPVSKHEIESLQDWLSGRLPDLIEHTEKVRELLKAGNSAEGIISSATELVISETPKSQPLSPQQIETWRALLPLVAEHSLLAVRNGKPAPADDKAYTKEEAAEYLGFSARKLERAMKKRQIEYEKYGAGKTATVRFRRVALDRYRDKRSVPTANRNP